jgi:Tfp pilus assembly protein PilF
MAESRIDTLKESLLKNPNDSFARYALAIEYQSLGDLETSIVLLKEVIERDPNYVPAYHQLGQTYTKLNRTTEAKEVYQKGIQVAEVTGDTHATEEMTEELEELEDEW